MNAPVKVETKATVYSQDQAKALHSALIDAHGIMAALFHTYKMDECYSMSRASLREALDKATKALHDGPKFDRSK